MVNYCCVYGCGRNSHISKHLTFFSLPKDRSRQEEWLKAAGREDLLNKSQEKLSLSHRICSRHFLPSNLKNKHLSPDAVPSLCLPGNWSDEEETEDPLPHQDIVCNHCTEEIVGFRYKCVTCDDFDLCQKCELNEAHPQHYMLRIPKSVQYRVVEKIINDWHKSFEELHNKESKEAPSKESCNIVNKKSNSLPYKKTRSQIKESRSLRKNSIYLSNNENIEENYDNDVDALASSDDEPINKYVVKRDYDNFDLDEDVKQKIRDEITRVLSIVKIEDDDKKKPKKNSAKKRVAEKLVRPNKKVKLNKDKNNEESASEANATTSHFAVVNGLFVIDGTNINILQFPTITE